MRANITVVVELPEDLDRMLSKVRDLCMDLDSPQVFRGSFQEYDFRDGTPAHVSFTVGGKLKEDT